MKIRAEGRSVVLVAESPEDIFKLGGLAATVKSATPTTEENQAIGLVVSISELLEIALK